MDEWTLSQPACWKKEGAWKMEMPGKHATCRPVCLFTTAMCGYAANGHYQKEQKEVKAHLKRDKWHLLEVTRRRKRRAYERGQFKWIDITFEGLSWSWDCPVPNADKKATNIDSRCVCTRKLDKSSQWQGAMGKSFPMSMNCLLSLSSFHLTDQSRELPSELKWCCSTLL